MTADMLKEAIAIQQIPAPTFDERTRAAYVADRFRALDLHDVTIDELQNVYARIPGAKRRTPNGKDEHKALLLSAHTDTVFDAETSLEIRRQHNRVYGPGIGDNSLGVAALLTAAEFFNHTPLPIDLWLVANSREEGLGDLGGIKATYKLLADKLAAAIVLEGMAFGRVYHAGIAVRRLHVRCHGEGGHSWLHFGRPSAIHGLMRLGAQITDIRVPESPRTTYNIGVIEGGSTVNSLASDASMLLDMRSEDKEALATLERQVRNLVEAQMHRDLTFSIEVVGDRPAGIVPRNHPLVQLARMALESVGAQPVYETGSTDANVLLAAGLPTVTVGITQGGNAHRTDEYIETPQLSDGLAQLFILMAAVGDWIKFA
ncbi:MAG: M20/M25/M40 family metallo-hydrolase [Anaerolineae bacterium]|nr:M20/M25/M40 family metallo-hydrolase [Anaerolineae bacterium]